MQHSDAFNLSSRQLLTRFRRGNLTVEDGEIVKLCLRCNEFYPFDEEFWYSYKSTTLKRYVSMAHCRSCERERANEKRRAKAVKNGKVERPTKIMAGGFTYYAI